MGELREPRSSEKTFRSIISDMLNLNICIWYKKGMKEEVEELKNKIKTKLDKMFDEFCNEK